MTSEPRDPATAAQQARDDVMRSMVSGDWTRARTRLDDAEALYDEAIAACTASDPRRDDLEEGRALCEVHRADIAIRYWRVGEAEQALDKAYAVLKKGSVEAELWRVTARIAERRARWSSAKAAWRKAHDLAAVANEGVAADALVRLAEIALNEGKPDAVRQRIDQVRGLGLDERVLDLRLAILEAELLGLAGDYDASLDAWKEAARDLQEIPQDFVALLNLRRAGVEVHRSPVTAVRRVLKAAALLSRLKHPDALGLAYGQLAVLATALGRPVLGALSAVGANASRDGDTVAHALLRAALEHAEIEVDFENLEGRQLQEALVGVLSGHARELGIAWSDLGTAKGLEKLGEPLLELGGAGVRVDVENRKVVEATQTVGHRSSLTWDAPLGVLRTVRLTRPLLLPKRPALYRPPPPPPDIASPVPPPGIPATPPPPPVRRRSAREFEIRLIAAASAVAVAGFVGILLLTILALATSRTLVKDPAPTARNPAPVAPSGPVVQVVRSDFPASTVLVPVELTSVGASGTLTVEGPAVTFRWSAGNGTVQLPPGAYIVHHDGQDTALVVDEGAVACRFRWLGDVIVGSCSQ